MKGRVPTFLARRSPTTIALAVIVVVVVAANGLFVLGLANGDPISWTAGISHAVCRVACERSSIDPNVGYLTQPLGHEVAMDLLHFHLPWWNAYEGLGQPLAGEMQSAALFPLTLLFAFSSGLLWFHISLEIIAGISTYFLARRLGLSAFLATVGAVLFALNGTYAWLGNAIANPVAFLPMLLLGVEMIVGSSSYARQRGWYVVAIALALSLYAGFPEVAYYDGLFVTVWAVVRLFSLPREHRPRALRRLGLGGLVGFVLALPALVPFGDFLRVAFVGHHTQAVDSAVHLTGTAVPMLFDPYVYGTIFANTNAHVESAWGTIGGYFGAGVCVLALVGLFGSRLRALRLFLAAWTLAGLAGALDVVHARTLWNLVPLVKNSTFPRFIMPSCEMAVVLLATLGLMDFVASKRAKRLFSGATLAMVVVVGWSALAARSANRGVVLSATADHWVIVLALIPFLALGLLLIAGRLTRFRWAALAVAVVVVGESLVLFLVPSVQAPKTLRVDQAPITFLQRHLGSMRYLDFSVLEPNWGTEYSINSLSAIDLPFPKAYKNFIESNLYPGLTPGNQFLIQGGITGITAQERALVAHFSAYENASVKYLLVPTGVALSAGLLALGVTPVFHDGVATIYQLPHPQPFFSTASPRCRVRSAGDDAVSVNCPSATTLLRRELSMAGWRVSVNGKPASVTTVDGVYQRVAIPAGRSRVTYTFLPPYEGAALVAALLAALFFVGSLVTERHPLLARRSVSRADRAVGPNDGGAGAEIR